MEIVSTQTKIYKPEFNPENDNYYEDIKCVGF